MQHLKQSDVSTWFDSQAEMEANIGVSLCGSSKLSSLPRGGVAGQEQGQPGQEQPARDGRAHRVQNAVATRCLA